MAARHLRRSRNSRRLPAGHRRSFLLRAAAVKPTTVMHDTPRLNCQMAGASIAHRWNRDHWLGEQSSRERNTVRGSGTQFEGVAHSSRVPRADEERLHAHPCRISSRPGTVSGVGAGSHTAGARLAAAGTSAVTYT